MGVLLGSPLAPPISMLNTMSPPGNTRARVTESISQVHITNPNNIEIGGPRGPEGARQTAGDAIATSFHRPSVCSCEIQIPGFLPDVPKAVILSVLVNWSLDFWSSSSITGTLRLFFYRKVAPGISGSPPLLPGMLKADLF